MEEGSDNGANIIIPVAEIPAQFYLIPFLYYLSFESKPKRSSSKSFDRLAREGRRRNRIKFKGSLLAFTRGEGEKVVGIAINRHERDERGREA